ncbi:hypothetical protein F511_28770 [Dorcoceras hygrometricum]|uniref:Uncharacterized protein n=1 Tax=Dorcoceras hygrometricum TaxID=472368 RepID=A0A2Z7BRR8_9LAMI|nr:hypothetical protein F511_28770 [Dorcoceras hygrometricum]
MDQLRDVKRRTKKSELYREEKNSSELKKEERNILEQIRTYENKRNLEKKRMTTSSKRRRRKEHIRGPAQRNSVEDQVSAGQQNQSNHTINEQNKQGQSGTLSELKEPLKSKRRMNLMSRTNSGNLLKSR